MVEFNPDGSIKLTGQLAKNIEENNQKMQSQRYIKIHKNVVNYDSPKKCVLQITLSKAFNDNRIVEQIYNDFKASASVPTTLRKIDEFTFEVEIKTDLRRCSDCTTLINKYREAVVGIIEEKGTCTYKGFSRNFSYDDYFE